MLARVLIGLAIVVLLVSPFTEKVARLDNFPTGGQDFELSMLFIIVVLCMVILAIFLGLKLTERLFKKTSRELHKYWTSPMGFLCSFMVATTVWVPPKRQIELGVFAAPLQI